VQKITDISTLLGIGITFILVLVSISLGESESGVLGFIDLRSLLIVVGGTYFLTMACFTIKEVWNAKLLVLRTVFYSTEDPQKAAKISLSIAEDARKNGILGLQNSSNKYKKNEFLDKGLNLIIDGMPYKEVEMIMENEIEATLRRHSTSSSILRKASDISPAMGLIGTLIGLVQMLGNLEDPSSIGPSMAIALLTTLYGAILSFMVFIPLASKLERISSTESMILQIYLITIISIGRKENPRKLEMILNAILPPEKRLNYFKI